MFGLMETTTLISQALHAASIKVRVRLQVNWRLRGRAGTTCMISAIGTLWTTPSPPRLAQRVQRSTSFLGELTSWTHRLSQVLASVLRRYWRQLQCFFTAACYSSEWQWAVICFKQTNYQSLYDKTTTEFITWRVDACLVLR